MIDVQPNWVKFGVASIQVPTLGPNWVLGRVRCYVKFCIEWHLFNISPPSVTTSELLQPCYMPAHTFAHIATAKKVYYPLRFQVDKLWMICNIFLFLNHIVWIMAIIVAAS